MYPLYTVLYKLLLAGRSTIRAQCCRAKAQGRLDKLAAAVSQLPWYSYRSFREAEQTSFKLDWQDLLG